MPQVSSSLLFFLRDFFEDNSVNVVVSGVACFDKELSSPQQKRLRRSRNAYKWKLSSLDYLKRRRITITIRIERRNRSTSFACSKMVLFRLLRLRLITENWTQVL